MVGGELADLAYITHWVLVSSIYPNTWDAFYPQNGFVVVRGIPESASGLPKLTILFLLFVRWFLLLALLMTGIEYISFGTSLNVTWTYVLKILLVLTIERAVAVGMVPHTTQHLLKGTRGLWEGQTLCGRNLLKVASLWKKSPERHILSETSVSIHDRRFFLTTV